MRSNSKIVTWLAGLLWFVGFTASAQGLPALIDRELFFGDPEIAAAQLSPDGKFISFLKPFNGTRNIWVKRADEPFDKAKPLTADTKRPISSYFWSRDSKYVLFAQDNAGDENFNVYAVRPDQAPAAGKDVPDARNITDAKGVRAMIFDRPKTDPDVLYVGINERDKAWHDLYKVRISTGERTLMRENTERVAGWEFDLQGNLRLAARTTDKGDMEILRVDQNGFTKIYECTVFESCGPVRFAKDGKSTYFVSNKGDADLTGLYLMDIATGQTKLVESDPEKRVDLGAPIFSDLTDELVGTGYVDEKIRVYWRDAAREADYKFLKQRFGDKDIRTQSMTADETLALIGIGADVEPGEVYLFDRKSKALTLQYRMREKIPRDALAAMQPIRYKSSDGLEIPAYLTLPKGIAAKNLPLIVVPHGGPWARDGWGYSGMSQFMANRGFAVLQMNFRGSTGYGKKFLNAGNGQWGEKMQDDVTWGVKHLIAQGIADPKRIAIMGGSYGGYTTLAGVAFTPDVYAAAVAIVAPSNLITLLGSIPPYWEAGRRQMYARMADPGTPEGKAKLERQSPLNSANKIKTPLMVVQGANDPRVKQAEADQIVVALREHNFPVEYIVAPDEGHGFARPINNMAMFAAAEAFLAKHIKGVRYQSDMKPEVATRLKEITVDPKTVEKPKVMVATSSAPKPAVDLRPGVFKYQVLMNRGGQSMELSSTTSIENNGATWKVTDTLQTPQGQAVDEGEYAKNSLQLTRRSVTQGPVTINYTVNGGKATGEMKMNTQSRPIDADLGGESFFDGPGAANVLATLPLADGYTTTFRSFNMQSQQMATTQVKVVGSERVSVPGGDFDSFKVEIESSTGAKATLWIAKSPRKAVKAIQSGSQLGGATLTTELLP